MRSITDLNDSEHRVDSASATYQKGIYHLFILKNSPSVDSYDRILRIYQCLFQLILTQLLLDFDYDFGTLKIPTWPKRHCRNPNLPTREEIDPAALVTHSTLEKWGGFRSGHPLQENNKKSLEVYNRVVEARHNLLYRPFMLDGCYWEDCTLITLLFRAPDVDELEELYQAFIVALVRWRFIEEQDVAQTKTCPARYFLQQLFAVYKDRSGKRPTETLLLTYARMLNPTDSQLVQEVRIYRNQLLHLEELVKVSRISFPDEWGVGSL